MALDIKKLYDETKTKYKLTLLAGEEGLGNIVSWVHFMEDDTTIDFIRGGELIITTGLRCDSPVWINRLVTSLVESKAGGLIINVGNYIKEVPGDVIEYCENVGFPLFIMPWEIHLVDLMQDYSSRLINEEQNELTVAAAFQKAIFSGEGREEYKEYLDEQGYKVDSSYCIINIKCKEESKKKVVALLRSKESVSLVKNNQIIIIINKVNKKNLNEYVNRISSLILKNLSGLEFKIGIGSVVNSLEDLHKSYEESVKARKVCEDKTFCFYEDIGIYKLILGVKNKEILTDFYHETFGRLEEYDKKHNTDYMNILKLYIECNYSIQAVAEKSFCHRNTVNYRVKKIKEILNNDLDDINQILKYQLAFYIKNLKENNQLL